MSEIQENSFVGITAMPQQDGTIKPVEMHVFAEPLRGIGVGHSPWDLMPNSSMTQCGGYAAGQEKAAAREWRSRCRERVAKEMAKAAGNSVAERWKSVHSILDSSHGSPPST